MRIYDRIREVRIRKNYTQEFMAIELGMDTSSYGRLERGICPVSLEKLDAIAKILKLPAWRLLKDDETADTNFAQESGELLYIRHLEKEVDYLRKSLQEKELQLNFLLNEPNSPSILAMEDSVKYRRSNGRSRP